MGRGVRRAPVVRLVPPTPTLPLKGGGSFVSFSVVSFSVRMSATILPRRRRLQLRHLATGLGAIIVGGALLMAIFAPILAPHDPFAQDLMARLTPPEWMAGGSAVHPFGTDQLGRDYLSRLIYGARISMLIGDPDRRHLRPDRHHARRAGRIFRRAGRRCGDVRHHLPPGDPADPGGADRGGAGRQFADGGGCHARPAAMGPLRRRGAHHDDAGAQPRLHRRGAGGRRVARAYPAARGAAEHR